MRKLQLIIALVCMGWTVKAQDTLKTVQLDEVVITGTKSEIPVEKSGKSIFKITRREIENSSARSVADLLNEVPGVQMDGNFGPLGTNISYFIRGASSKRTLVLIDGVPFNDASGIDQTYDFRLLDLDQVESIEVLKGGLSTLYGTGAAAGVINITLKKASDELSGNVKAEYGSFNTVNTSAGVSGRIDKVSYVVNGGYKKSDGFSAAKDDSGSGNFDNDGFEGYNFLGKVGYQLSESFNIGFTGAYDYFETDFDAGAFADAQNNFSEYKQLRFGLTPTFKWQRGSLKGSFFLSKLERFFDSSGFISDNDAKNFQGDIFVDQNLSDKIKLIGGLNYQRLAYSQPNVEEERFEMIDPYITFIYDESDYNFQIGGRINNHSDYGTNFVFNVSQSKIIKVSDEMSSKLIASYSTSFITPSLFQLFGPFGANPDLEPEESRSAEGGFSVFNEKFNLDAVYFYRKDDNLILFTGGAISSYVNADGKIETDGLEIGGGYTFGRSGVVNANYTYTRRLNDEIAYRIPTHKYGLSVSYMLIDNLTTRVSYLHTGERNLQYFDNDTFETRQVDADAFDLIDFLVTYQWDQITFSGSLNNLFDEDYEAIAGFNSVGRNYRIGVKYSFK